MSNVKFTGDWNRLKKNLSRRNVKELTSAVDEQAKVLQKTIQGHIDRQDLGWSPLSKNTIRLKHGNSTIYVDTGTLRNSITTNKISSSDTYYSVGVKVKDGKSPKNGESLSNIMNYMEYGTARQPARPLIRPSWEEKRSSIKSAIQKAVVEFFTKG